MEPIGVWSYLEEYEQEKAEIHAAIEKVLTSGRLILGQSVLDFEHAFSSYSGAAHGIGCNSGTDALFLALKTLGIGTGDAVITVANTAVPTVSAIVSAGARPIFVDINPRTYLMDTDQLASAVTPDTKCILPVHLYGQCVDVEALIEFARTRDLHIVEDCAQSHGATYRGRKAGSLGDLSAFSFYPTKPLGGFGDGGMVCTSSKTWAEKTRRLRMYGMEKQYYAIEHGYNSRLDELQAEILSYKLTRLDNYIDRRRVLARQYEELLADTELILPQTQPGNEHVFYVYVCRHPRRDDIVAGLKEHGVLVNISYPWPIHTMSAYTRFGGQEGGLPETEKAAREIFSLPMYPALTDDQQQRVVDALHKVLASLA